MKIFAQIRDCQNAPDAFRLLHDFTLITAVFACTEPAVEHETRPSLDNLVTIFMLQNACPAGSRGNRVLTAVAAAVFRSRTTHNGILGAPAQVRRAAYAIRALLSGKSDQQAKAKPVREQRPLALNGARYQRRARMPASCRPMRSVRVATNTSRRNSDKPAMKLSMATMNRMAMTS